MEWVVGALVGVFLAQVALFVTSIDLHRMSAHRVPRLSRVARGVCRLLLWVTTRICPREWVASGAIHAVGHRWGKGPHDTLAANNGWPDAPHADRACDVLRPRAPARTST